MLSYLLTAAFIYAAARALRWLRNRGKRKSRAPAPHGRQPSPFTPPPVDPEVERIRERKTDAIDNIAARVRFSSLPVKLESVKVGTQQRSTPIPSGEIVVRPIQQMAELPRLTPSALAYDDDLFFGQLAGRQLPVIDHVENVDLIVDRYGVPGKILVYLTDDSGSMEEHDRHVWARALCERVLGRAERMDAETHLLPFTNVRPHALRAKTPDEYAHLRRRLGQVFNARGGTDLSVALEAGMDVIETGEQHDRKILLVTDGTEDINISKTRRRLKKLKIELHVVCIGVEHEGLRSIADLYDHFPDEV